MIKCTRRCLRYFLIDFEFQFKSTLSQSILIPKIRKVSIPKLNLSSLKRTQTLRQYINLLTLKLVLFILELALNNFRLINNQVSKSHLNSFVFADSKILVNNSLWIDGMWHCQRRHPWVAFCCKMNIGLGDLLHISTSIVYDFRHFRRQ